MKILSVKFLNLNSLKGEHEIRFDQPPFTESGLFAITGPTGAGKTTILDAITLALYGKVHRHEKEDPSEIMTRHTGESYAEVEFEAKEIIYRSRWSNRRAHKKARGVLQEAKMELANAATNEILESSLSRHKAKIIEVCGLDYNQFLRSVILSQGDFTRFLKSNENERSDLLEKITDTYIYSQISIFIFDKTREEKSRLDGLIMRLNDVVLLPAEEKNAYMQNLAALRVEEYNAQLEEIKLREKAAWLHQLDLLKTRRQQLLTTLQADEEFFVVNRQGFEKLEKHQLASVYKPALAEIKTARDLVNKTEKDLTEQRDQLPSLQSAATVLSASLDKARLFLEQTQKELLEKEPLFELVVQKDALIDHTKIQLIRAANLVEESSLNVERGGELQNEVTKNLLAVRERLDDLSEWLTNNAQDSALDKEMVVFTNYKKALTDLEPGIDKASANSIRYKKQLTIDRQSLSTNEKEREDIRNKIESINKETVITKEKLAVALNGKSLDGLENSLASLPDLIKVYQEQFRIAEGFILNEKTLQSTIKEQELEKTMQAEESRKLEQLKTQKADAAEKLADLQRLFELEVKIQKYDVDRVQLQPEKPCPLCGSFHHPYVHDNYKSHVSEVEKRRNDQRKILDQLGTSLDKKAIDVNTISNKLQAGAVKTVELQKTLSAARQEFDTNNRQLHAAVEIAKPASISSLVKSRQQEQEELRLIVKNIKGLQQRIAENETSISKQRENLAQAEGKLEQAKIRITHAEEQVARIEIEAAGLAENKKEIVGKLTQLLARFNIDGDLGTMDSIASLISKRYETYTQAHNRLSGLQLQQRQLETEQRSSVETLEEKKRLLKVQELQLAGEEMKLRQLETERIELFGNKHPAYEKKQLNKKLEQERATEKNLQLDLHRKQQQVGLVEDRILKGTTDLEAYKSTLDIYLQSLVKKLNENGIASVEALMPLFMNEEEARSIDLLQKEAVQKITTGKRLLAATEHELEIETSKGLTTETAVAIQQEVEKQGLALRAINQQVFKVEQILGEDERLKIKYKEVALEIETQRQEFERWNKLSALIGSADGKRFSRFAQGLTLARLTALANRHLLRLSDRYQILKSPEKDLELQIVDGYQADVVRPMSTLSGGESFLVSLALALGLSDLASRKVQINSLFIDEGFGTLDADTLDIAISALENLQANGKAIGIISHVEALKEGIGTQIQVSKQPGGYSTIRITSYGQKIKEV